LRKHAQQLENQAAELRKFAADVHTLSVTKQLTKLTKSDDDKIDLLSAALLIASLDNQELDAQVYIEQVAGMVEEIRGELPREATETQKLTSLNRYLFENNGYHGSRTNYYHRANSYINQVLDDREGLPITLSVLYMELGRRLGLRIEGVGLPGHFIVRQVAKNGETQLVDVFDGGTLISEKDAGRIVREFAGREIADEDLRPYTRRAILTRMLGNLMGLAQRDDDKEAMLRYVEAMLAVEPDTPAERGMRAVLRFETGRRAAAIADLDWFLETEPEGVELERIHQMRDLFLKSR
jgi:serine protease Do